MTSTSRQRQDANKIRKKMSKEQLHLALTKKRECDARALVIVERLIEDNVEQIWMLENLEHINQCHMEDVVEERAILKRCGYALCDNTLQLNINQKYHISTRSNKVYDVSRRKNFCSNNCYGAANFLIEQMLTSPLWLRDPKEKPQFQLLPVSGLSQKSTPGDEVNLGRENIFVDSNKLDEDSKAQNLDDPTAGEDSTNKNSKSDDIQDSGNEEEPQRLQEKVVIEEAEEAPKLQESMRGLNLEVDGSEINTDDILVVEHDLKLEHQGSSTADMPRKRQPRKISVKKEQGNKKFDPKCMVERIERYFEEWITLDSLVLLLGDPSLKKNAISEKRERFESEEVQKKYLKLCQKVNCLQIEEDSDEEERKADLRPLPDYHLLKEEGKKLEIKVKAFFEGRTMIETPAPLGNPFSDEVEDANTFLPTLSEKEPKALRRRIVLEKLDKVLPEMLRTLAGGEFTVPGCISSNGCGKNVKALVNTFSLSASNVIPKPAEWNLLGLVFIKLLSITEPRLRFLLGTERARKYVTLILMSYNLEANYLDRLVAVVTDVEVYRKKEELGINEAS